MSPLNPSRLPRPISPKFKAPIKISQEQILQAFLGHATMGKGSKEVIKGHFSIKKQRMGLAQAKNRFSSHISVKHCNFYKECAIISFHGSRCVHIIEKI